MSDPDARVGGAGAPPTPRWWGHAVREYTWPIELRRLLADPVWRGVGVPEGDGRPVLLVPGFLAGDGSLRTLATWLRRRGYHVACSGIRWNVGCSERHLATVESSLERLHTRTGQPVVVVGHSRGGLLGNAVAGLRPDLVARVVTLGSPLADNFDIAVLTRLAVAGARRAEHALHPESRARDCFSASCVCAFRRGAETGAAGPVPLTCIVTDDDGVVAPRSCTLPKARTLRVRGTHVGLIVNAEVYRILGAELAAR